MSTIYMTFHPSSFGIPVGFFSFDIVIFAVIIVTLTNKNKSVCQLYFVFQRETKYREN
jgi:hypothetical protein